MHIYRKNIGNLYLCTMSLCSSENRPSECKFDNNVEHSSFWDTREYVPQNNAVGTCIWRLGAHWYYEMDIRVSPPADKIHLSCMSKAAVGSAEILRRKLSGWTNHIPYSIFYDARFTKSLEHIHGSWAYSRVQIITKQRRGSGISTPLCCIVQTALKGGFHA